MIEWSTRLQGVQPSATAAMNELAKTLVQQGHDVINLSFGEPDQDTPLPVQEAAIRAIRGGQTKYTLTRGTYECRVAVAEKFERENSLTYTPHEIIVAPGGKQVLFNAFFATVNPGDEVIIPRPYWVTYPDIIRSLHGQPVFVDCFEEDGFKLTPESLEAAITPRTKWFVFNAPSNPTGAVYSYDEMKALTNVLLKHPHVLIMADDVYEPFVYDGQKFHTIAEVEPRLFDRTLTMNGVSKGYAMTGWRVGYGAGPQKLIDGMAIAQSLINSHTVSISQAATIEALRGDQSLKAAWNDMFKERRDFVVEHLNQMDGISCSMPGGAFYAFPSCAAHIGKTTPGGLYIENDGELVRGVLTEAFVASIAGTEFGAPGHFRISYAASNDELDRACDRMGNFFAKLKP